MIRITGGELRGRSIQTPNDLKTRPTQAKLRQALFNSVQALIPGARVLDLFAGSGALGFEALSRGAESAVFVESAKPVIGIIERNAASLGVGDRSRIIGAPVERAVEHLLSLAPFDLVLADPPYAGGWETKLLTDLPWDRLLSPGGKLFLEWGTQKSKTASLLDSYPFLVKTREKIYGESVLTTFERIP